MAFPTSPVNNQTATINGTVYYYDSSRLAWRVDAAINNPGATTGTFSNVTVSSALVIPSGNTTVRANTGVTSGTMRLNTDSGNLEVYYTNANGSAWFSAVNLNLYTGPKAYSSAAVTANGNYTIHTFTSSGTFNPTQTLAVDYLIVSGGGGGGGWSGGGGGAGGLLSGNTTLTSQTYTITIGSGGTGAPTGTYTNSNWSSGSNTTFANANATIISTTGGGAGKQ